GAQFWFTLPAKIAAPAGAKPFVRRPWRTLVVQCADRREHPFVKYFRDRDLPLMVAENGAEACAICDREAAKGFGFDFCVVEDGPFGLDSQTIAADLAKRKLTATLHLHNTWRGGVSTALRAGFAQVFDADLDTASLDRMFTRMAKDMDTDESANVPKPASRVT